MNKNKYITQVDIALDGTLIVSAKVDGKFQHWELDQETLFTILELQDDRIHDHHTVDPRIIRNRKNELNK